MLTSHPSENYAEQLISRAFVDYDAPPGRYRYSARVGLNQCSTRNGRNGDYVAHRGKGSVGRRNFQVSRI